MLGHQSQFVIFVGWDLLEGNQDEKVVHVRHVWGELNHKGGVGLGDVEVVADVGISLGISNLGRIVPSSS